MMWLSMLNACKLRNEGQRLRLSRVIHNTFIIFNNCCCGNCSTNSRSCMLWLHLLLVFLSLRRRVLIICEYSLYLFDIIFIEEVDLWRARLSTALLVL